MGHNCYSIPADDSFELYVKWQNIFYAAVWLFCFYAILTALNYPFHAKYITPQQLAQLFAIDLSLMSSLIFGWPTLYLFRNDLFPEDNRLKLLDGSVLTRGNAFIQQFEPAGRWFPYVQTTQFLSPLLAGIIIDQFYLSFDLRVFLVTTVGLQVMLLLPYWYRYLRKPTPDGVIVQIRPAELVTENTTHQSGYLLTICRERKKRNCVVDLPVLDPSMFVVGRYGNVITNKSTLMILATDARHHDCDHLVNDSGDIILYESNQESEIQRYQQFLHEWLDPLMTHRMITQ